MKSNILVYLPEDLVVEILSRVPALSLLRLRSTSRTWNALVKDEKFTKKHSANTAPRSRRHSSQGIMLVASRVSLVSFNLHESHNNVASSVKLLGQLSLKDPLSDNSSEQVHIRTVYHYDGLLLCSTKDKRLVVCNPCSGVTRWIQPRKSYNESDSYVLGFDNQSSCYKILMIDRRRRLISVLGYRTRYEIYDLASNTWRVVVGLTKEWLCSPGSNCGVSLKGNTYWVDQREEGNVLLSFDFSTERFQSLPLPHEFLPHIYGTALSVVREDQLCLLTKTFYVASVDIDVWVTTKIESNAGVVSWCKFLTVKIDHSNISLRMGFLADHENKVVVCCGEADASNEIRFHIVGEDQSIQVDHSPGELSNCRLLLSYVPSLKDAKGEAVPEL